MEKIRVLKSMQTRMSTDYLAISTMGGPGEQFEDKKHGILMSILGINARLEILIRALDQHYNKQNEAKSRRD